MFQPESQRQASGLGQDKCQVEFDVSFHGNVVENMSRVDINGKRSRLPS